MATSSLPTYNYLVPADGTTHAVFQQCDFPVSGSVSEDWNTFSANHFKFRPQGAYIDNTGGSAPAVLSLQGLPFFATVPAGFAGWVSFPAVANMVTIVSGTGTVNVVYVDWPVFTSAFVDIDGNPPGGNVTIDNPVTSPVNDQLIVAGAAVSSGNPLPVEIENTNLVLAPVPALLVSGSATAAGSTTIGTPVANSNLRKLVLSITENATMAAAGENLLTIALNGVTVFTEQVYIPSAALSNAAILYHRDIPFDSVAFNTGATGTLTATLETALDTGALNVNAYFD